MSTESESTRIARIRAEIASCYTEKYVPEYSPATQQKLDELQAYYAQRHATPQPEQRFQVLTKEEEAARLEKLRKEITSCYTEKYSAPLELQPEFTRNEPQQAVTPAMQRELDSLQAHFAQRHASSQQPERFRVDPTQMQFTRTEPQQTITPAMQQQMASLQAYYAQRQNGSY